MLHIQAYLTDILPIFPTEVIVAVIAVNKLDKYIRLLNKSCRKPKKQYFYAYKPVFIGFISKFKINKAILVYFCCPEQGRILPY